MTFSFGGLNISLNDDTNGGHSQDDVFTTNITYSASTGDIVGQSTTARSLVTILKLEG